jgi:hypothetical protein
MYDFKDFHTVRFNWSKATICGLVSNNPVLRHLTATI